MVREEIKGTQSCLVAEEGRGLGGVGETIVTEIKRP